MANKDYKVGYGKPPKEYQFKKGVSGNKAGRKRKPIPKSLQEAFAITANEKIKVTNENGVTEYITLFEYFMKKILRDAIAKEGSTRKFILDNFLKIDLLSSYNHLVERQYETDNKDELDPELRKQMLMLLADMAAKEKTKEEAKTE